jgi:mannosyltransferase
MSVGVVADTSRSRWASVGSAGRALTRATPIVVGLTVVAAVLRFVWIGHQSFWYDESFTVVLTHHSFGQMLGLVPRTELTPPLYYCLAWVWARLFGYGEVGLRSLSALAGVATVPVMYGVGAKLISRRAGLIAAALACCNPLLIWYSQEARSYALLVLLAALSLLAFAYVRLPQPSWRQLGMWALAASLTLATHYYGVLIVVPEALWLLWVQRRDRRVLLAVTAVAAFGLALVPIAISQRPNADWIARWQLDQRLSQIAPQYLLGTGAPARTWLKLGGAAVVLLVAVMLAWRADSSERRGALVSGMLAVTGFLLSLGLVVAGVDELITRNVILVLIPLIVLIASGLGARRAGVLGVLGAVTLCTIGLVAATAVAVDWNLQRPDWRAVARVIGPRQPTSAGRAILIQRYRTLLPLALYVHGLRFMNARGGRVNELDVIAINDPPHDGWFCWWGSTCNIASSELDTAIRLRGFHRDGPVLHVNQFLILRLRSRTSVQLTPRKVSRALTTTLLPSDGLLVQPPA